MKIIKVISDIAGIIVIYWYIIRPVLLWLLDNVILRRKTDLLFRYGWRKLFDGTYWYPPSLETISFFKLLLMSYDQVEILVKSTDSGVKP